MLPGISNLKVHFADNNVLMPDVLVAMNDAAFKAYLGDLLRGSIIIVNTNKFSWRHIANIEYAQYSLSTVRLTVQQIHEVLLTSNHRQETTLTT